MEIVLLDAKDVSGYLKRTYPFWPLCIQHLEVPRVHERGISLASNKEFAISLHITIGQFTIDAGSIQ